MQRSGLAVALTGALWVASGCKGTMTIDGGEQEKVGETGNTGGSGAGGPIFVGGNAGTGGALGTGSTAGTGGAAAGGSAVAAGGTFASDGGSGGDVAGGTSASGGMDTGEGGESSGGTEPGTGGRAGAGGGAGTGPGGQTGGTPPAVDCPDVGLDAGVIHYVCDCQAGAAAGCAPGDDSASGAVGAPWRTVQKARQAFQSATAGETIAFCRGGSFDASGGAWVNENASSGCTAAEPCVVRDYEPPAATGAEARPILSVSSGHGIDLANGGDAEHEEGYVFLNLDVRSTSGGSSGNGVFVYNDVDDVLVCNSSFDGFQVGFYMAGSNPAAAGSDGKNVRIELRGSTVTNSGNQGMLGSCDDCVLAHNTFENNGYAATTPAEGTRNHNIYLSAHTLVHGMKVIGNQLYRSAIVDGSCTGTSLVAHGLFDDLLIEGNGIREDVGATAAGCWGLSVDTGYAGEREAFSNVQIRRNTVLNAGNAGIGLNGCDTCTIENNLVIQEQAFGTTLISVPVRDRGTEDAPMSNVTVRNNTLVDLSSASVTAISLGGEGTGHVSSGNAILGDRGGTLSCFSYGLSDASYGVRNDNLCFVASGTLRWAAGTALAAFQTASGADADSVSVDPRFVSSAAPFDFHPMGDSPLIDEAPATSPSDDLEGKARDGKPDIGALER